MTSSYQKTAKASAYNCADSPPRISVAALLAVARWLQQRRLALGGSQPCTPRTDALSPPPSPRTTLSVPPRELWNLLSPTHQVELLQILTGLIARRLLLRPEEVTDEPR